MLSETPTQKLTESFSVFQRLYQGCQMVYFQIKNPNLGNFGGPWNGKY
jgi:hypothetical protein